MKAYWTSAEVLLNFIGYLGKLALLVGCISVSIQIILILTSVLIILVHAAFNVPSKNPSLNLIEN